MPRKLGRTIIDPTIYQGALDPILVLNLSLANPTIGVVIPSANCPDNIASPA